MCNFGQSPPVNEKPLYETSNEEKYGTFTADINSSLFNDTIQSTRKNNKKKLSKPPSGPLQKEFTERETALEYFYLF